MTLHVFANIVTKFGVANNNRGETEGNATTLQKLIWYGETHTSVSAEAIRFALRRRLYDAVEKNDGRPQTLHRWWDEQQRRNEWNDYDTKAKSIRFAEDSATKYIDDDLLGYMSAEAAKEEGGKGSASVRRAVLELTRAMSLTPWPGDVVFNAASPRATPAAAKGEGDNPVPYAAEVHATRYQFGLAMTPARLRRSSRAALALENLAALGEVAGNHGRFLFDFSPDSIILRLTDDPAPRLLFCFTTTDDARTVTVTDDFEALVGTGGADIRGDELIIGGPFAATPVAKQFKERGATLFPNQVRAAVETACKRIADHPDVKGQ
jgi:CRISPR-associated protein Cst2